MVRLVLVFAVAVFVSACSGVRLIATDDPAVKISQADAMAKQGRAGQAQRLLKEAMAIYQQRGDNLGLGEAHRQFGFLARQGQGRDGLILVQNPQTITPTQADFELSQRHFKQALELFVRADRFDWVANVYFLLGSGSSFLGEREQACAYMDQSLAVHRQWAAAHPGVTVDLPRGMRDYGELIKKAKSEVGCG